MKARTPAFSNGGAGLTDGYDERQWRQMQEADHGAGTYGKRSPKERSAVPGASQRRRHSSSQRGRGSDLTASVQGGGPAPASKIVTGIGTSRWREIVRASRPMPGQQPSPSSNNPIRTRTVEAQQ